MCTEGTQFIMGEDHHTWLTLRMTFTLNLTRTLLLRVAMTCWRGHQMGKCKQTLTCDTNLNMDFGTVHQSYQECDIITAVFQMFSTHCCDCDVAINIVQNC